MNNKPLQTKISFALLALFISGTATAETSETSEQAPLIAPDRPVFFASQKVWAATWDVSMLDTVVTLVTPTTPAVKGYHYSGLSDTEFVPITSAGVKYGNFNFALNYTANTNFSSTNTTGTDASRKEWDMAFGYSILPNLTASFVYKKARVDRGMTQSAQTLLGVNNSLGYDIKGKLIGLSASAPLQGGLSLYGNMAFGEAKEIIDDNNLFGSTTNNGNYKIGELGLSYRLTGSASGVLKSLSAQIGYRAQVITLKNLEFDTISTTGAVLSTQNAGLKSSTDGLIIGLTAAF